MVTRLRRRLLTTFRKLLAFSPLLPLLPWESTRMPGQSRVARIYSDSLFASLKCRWALLVSLTLVGGRSHGRAPRNPRWRRSGNHLHLLTGTDADDSRYVRLGKSPHAIGSRLRENSCPACSTWQPVPSQSRLVVCTAITAMCSRRVAYGCVVPFIVDRIRLSEFPVRAGGA